MNSGAPESLQSFKPSMKIIFIFQLDKKFLRWPYLKNVAGFVAGTLGGHLVQIRSFETGKGSIFVLLVSQRPSLGPPPSLAAAQTFKPIFTIYQWYGTFFQHLIKYIL
jgi:hypothetical protein